MQSRLILGDCLERMAEIADGSVDCIISDLPCTIPASLVLCGYENNIQMGF